MADRRVEEDQVSGLQLAARHLGAELGLRAAGVRQRDARGGVGVGRQAGAVEGVRARWRRAGTGRRPGPGRSRWPRRRRRGAAGGSAAPAAHAPRRRW